MEMPPQCDIAFCGRAARPNSCSVHHGVFNVGWLTIQDPESGLSALMYDGVRYTVEFRQSETMRGKVEGILNTELSQRGTLRLDLDSGGYIVIPRLCVTGVWA
jgi:hypothetical protein